MIIAAEMAQPAAAHLAARRSPTPATSPRSCPGSTRATCCSSTRSTGCRGPPRRCSTWRWRTSGSTSSSARGPGATAIPLEIPPFTLVGATTRAGLLPGPLRDRFGFTAHLEFYEPAELDQIVRRSAGLLGVDAHRRAAPPRSPPAPAARPGSPTGCCAGSATTPRCAPTAWSPSTSRTGRSTSTRSTSRAWTGSTGRCSTCSAAASAADRSASPRWRSPWARSARPSRRSPSRSWCAPACWPAPRAAGSPRRPPGQHLGLAAPARRAVRRGGRRAGVSATPTLFDPRRPSAPQTVTATVTASCRVGRDRPRRRLHSIVGRDSRLLCRARTPYSRCFFRERPGRSPAVRPDRARLLVPDRAPPAAPSAASWRRPSRRSASAPR